MAITGDLENLHIVDIIQLIHTTRMSGTFSVNGSKGESRIIFSDGYIVGATHLNNKIRIGTVLAKMKLVTPEDIEQAMNTQKNAGKDRLPLLVTLLKMGKLREDEAAKALRKLIEITIVELMSWTKGNFTFDTEAIAVSHDCSYRPGQMEQVMTLDAQMVLMDALRIYDEQEHDRRSGKDVPSYEELFADAISAEGVLKTEAKTSALTAEDLGLAEIDRLEKKIPQPVSVEEIFSPVEIHRQKIRETLPDFSTEEQEALVSFLGKSMAHISVHDAAARQGDRAKSLIFFSEDEILRHLVMTICKNEGILVFASDEEDELNHILARCLSIKSVPVLVFDNPGKSEGGLSKEKIIALRQKIKEKSPQISILQLVSPPDYTFTLQSLRDGVRVVFPKPLKEVRKETFIADMIQFLETLKTYIKGMVNEQMI